MPPLMGKLMAEGRWPRNDQQAMRQFVSKDCRQALRRIHLYAPPFRTFSRLAAAGWDAFYGQFGAVHELIPEFTLSIANFGVGSDSPILLDFQIDRTNPRVIYLHWQGDGGENYGEDNHWDAPAPDFPSFVQMLGL